MYKNNIFITGSAGTGKSFLLKELLPKLEGTVCVTASTGISAINIGGTTLHKLVGLGLAKENKDVLLTKIHRNKRLRNLWQSIDVLVIDEISMMDIGFFIKISEIIASVRGEVIPMSKINPFGSITLILIGDFLQLPPVTIYEDSGIKYKYLFEHPIWNDMNLKTIMLSNPKRYVTYTGDNQSICDITMDILKGNMNKSYVEPIMDISSDDEGYKFFKILSDVRLGKNTSIVQEFIKKSAVKPKISNNGIAPTVLIAINKEVDKYNNDQLAKLTTQEKTYKALFKASKDSLITESDMLKTCLAPETLSLKIGAQVMLLVNMPDLELGNGSRGIVIGYSDSGYPLVQFLNDKKLMVTPHTWSASIKYEIDGSSNSSKSELTQIPLKLAYSLTIHKSQGLSLDCVYLYSSSIFASGQLYVALSRCRDSNYLYTIGLDNAVLARSKPDKSVIEFYNKE